MGSLTYAQDGSKELQDALAGLTGGLDGLNDQMNDALGNLEEVMEGSAVMMEQIQKMNTEEMEK